MQMATKTLQKPMVAKPTATVLMRLPMMSVGWSVSSLESNQSIVEGSFSLSLSLCLSLSPSLSVSRFRVRHSAKTNSNWKHRSNETVAIEVIITPF